MRDYLRGGRLWRMCLKELRESLRDRRTVMTLILMPILVYPLLSMALQRLLISSVPKSQQKAYVIGVEDPELGPRIRELLDEAQNSLQSGVQLNIRELRDRASIVLDSSDSDASRSVVKDKEGTSNDESDSEDMDRFELGKVERISIREALQTGVIDLAVTRLEVVTVPTRRGESRSFNMETQFIQGDIRGEAASKAWRRMCQTINDFQFQNLRRSLDPSFLPAVSLEARAIGVVSDASASVAGVIPLVLILMTITGAVYPAIDLTAGERERGTMEAMIATPAPRFALLLSKYVAVVCVAILTALANLLATWVTLSFGGLGQAILGPKGFSVWTLLQILPILAIFACFFSSILLALCSFAKSFKEAQAYLIPVMLFSLAPGLVTLMPNVQFSTLFAVVPLLNVLLLSRDIMIGSPPLVPSFVAVFTTLFYGGASLVIASNLFGRANSALGGQATWSDLIQRPSKSQKLPDLGHLAIYLAVLFPLIFILSSWSGTLSADTATIMGMNALILVVLFGMLPMAWLSYQRVSLRHTYQFTDGGEGMPLFRRGLRVVAIMVGVLLTASVLWLPAVESVLWFKDWSLAEQIPDLEKYKAKWLAVSFGWILVTQALAPAVAEECFFRGFALGAFRDRVRPLRSVLYTALLFGLFHVITGNVLSPEKFPPTFLLGLVLGWVAWVTRSIWPGVLLHATHNGLVLWFSRLEKDQLKPWFGESEHVPLGWLGVSCIVVFFGLAILFSTSRSRSN